LFGKIIFSNSLSSKTADFTALLLYSSSSKLHLFVLYRRYIARQLDTVANNSAVLLYAALLRLSTKNDFTYSYSTKRSGLAKCVSR